MSYLGMKHVLNQNASDTKRSFSGEQVDDASENSQNDVMTRRMKNRERQRRYRARKRLEADSTKPILVSQSTPEVMDPDPIAVVHNWNHRIHSRRKWKKEARLARKTSVSTSDSQSSSGLTSGEKSELMLGSESCLNVDRVNHATNEATMGRRDWKAEARARKS